MATRRINVFFYGLFMDAELFRSKGVSPQNIRARAFPASDCELVNARRCCETRMRVHTAS